MRAEENDPFTFKGTKVSERGGRLIFFRTYDGHGILCWGGTDFDLFCVSANGNVSFTHKIHSDNAGKLQVIDELHGGFNGMVCKVDGDRIRALGI